MRTSDLSGLMGKLAPKCSKKQRFSWQVGCYWVTVSEKKEEEGRPGHRAQVVVTQELAGVETDSTTEGLAGVETDSTTEVMGKANETQHNNLYNSTAAF